MSDKILEKIKRLFALSENNSSEEESQAALLKARQLLQKHGLSMMDIDVQTDSKEDRMGCEEVSIDGRTMLPKWITLLAGVIALYFDIGCVFVNKKHGHLVSFYGNKFNSQAAAVAFPNLVSQVEYLAKNYKTMRMEYMKSASLTRQFRESYIFGLIDGFNNRLIMEKAREQSEAAESSTALALYNEDLTKAWEIHADWNIRKKKEKKKTVLDSAFLDGHIDSDKLSLTLGLDEKKE
jgi:hypothetical protein